MPGAPVRFLDTNVLIRLLTRDDPDRAALAADLLARIAHGNERVAISPLVVFEVVFLLHGSYRLPRQRTRDLVRAIITLRSVALADKELWVRALGLYAESNISFADVFNSAYMEMRGIDQIYSWDTDFDRIAGNTRLEPE